VCQTITPWTVLYSFLKNAAIKKCPTKDIGFEFFFKKIVIYADFGIYGHQRWEFTHVSDQLHSGAWTSKLGKGVNIRHESPELLAGNVSGEYGEIFQVLKKCCWPSELAARAYFKAVKFLKRAVK
jgi:hypothetical protein